MLNQGQYESVKCNLCDSQDYKVVYKAREPRERQRDLREVYRASGDEFLFDQLVKCSSCGLIYVNPRLKYEQILNIYRAGEDRDFVSQSLAREKTFANYAKLLEKYSPVGKILDIGTGSGAFLAAAKKRGWDVYGIEPNVWLSGWASKNYGINVQSGTLRAQNYPDNFFDVVTLWDVLEHVGDPKGELLEIGRILKPGGLLIVNFPDISSLLAKAFGRKWWFLLSVHLYYFSPRTMKKLLDSAGFKFFKKKMHIQYLSLGYLLGRIGSYNKGVAKFLGAIASISRTSNLLVPYYAAQTNIFCRNGKKS